MSARLFLSTFFCVLSCVSMGQNPAKLHLTAESQSSQIRLRWAVDCPVVWQLANRYGYTLERVEILENSIVIDFPRRRILNGEPIKPADSTAWMEKFDKHQSYAILSQALFGENFETLFQANHPMFEAINQIQQSEQRFSIALLAADQNFDAACLAGLGWIDSVVDSRKTYLYRLYINSPDSLILGDTAMILVSPSEQMVFPKITNIFSEAGDKTVFLLWNINNFRGVYTNYIVEKSENGRHFFEITETTLTISENGKTAMFIDTLESNGNPYFYRIRGVNVFGTSGPVSDVVRVIGENNFLDFPENLTVSESGRNVVLQWTFNENVAKDLSHFLVFHQPNLNAGKTELSRVSARQRRFEMRHSTLEASNYFTVVAVYKNGQQRSSYACFFQIIDSVPPLAPRELLGIADSLGVVKLQWQKNTETDLAGYQVFRANQRNQEVVRISETLLTDTFFFDTISTNTDRSVFYQIRAIDNRGNKSEFSAIAEVERVNEFPEREAFSDLVAKFSADIPESLAAPRLTASADRENRRIVLNWQMNYAVSEVRIFRKKDNEDWFLLGVFQPTNNSYEDLQLKINSTYQYRIICIADDGRISPISAVVRAVY